MSLSDEEWYHINSDLNTKIGSNRLIFFVLIANKILLYIWQSVENLNSFNIAIVLLKKIN